jgi:hypothetical protein
LTWWRWEETAVRASSRIGLVAAGAVAAFCATVLPAAAAPVVNLQCETGALKFQCFDFNSGTTSTPTIHWTINGNYISAYDNRASIGNLSCAPSGSRMTIAVAVTDSSGTTSQQTGFACSPNPWQ